MANSHLYDQPKRSGWRDGLAGGWLGGGIEGAKFSILAASPLVLFAGLLVATATLPYTGLAAGASFLGTFAATSGIGAALAGLVGFIGGAVPGSFVGAISGSVERAGYEKKQAKTIQLQQALAEDIKAQRAGELGETLQVLGGKQAEVAFHAGLEQGYHAAAANLDHKPIEAVQNNTVNELDEVGTKSALSTVDAGTVDYHNSAMEVGLHTGTTRG